MNKEKKVFISYTREDHEIAIRIYEDIKKINISAWIDKIDLLPGQNWRAGISQTIQDSSYFIALISSNSLPIKGFVQNELKMAFDILDSLPAQDIFIIPIRVDDCHLSRGQAPVRGTGYLSVAGL